MLSVSLFLMCSRILRAVFSLVAGNSNIDCGGGGAPTGGKGWVRRSERQIPVPSANSTPGRSARPATNDYLVKTCARRTK